MDSFNAEAQHPDYFFNKIKALKITIASLIEKTGTTREKCLIEYKKRIKAEGEFLKFPVFTEKKSQKTFEITRNITFIKSKKDWDKRINTAKKGKNKQIFSGGGIITFRYPKNTRGNSANVQALIGTAIILIEEAERDLKKNITSSYDYLLNTIEICGIVKGKLDKRSSNEIQKEEIRNEINETLKRNPSLSPTSATSYTLTSLGLPRRMLRNCRRLAPKKPKK